MSSRDFSVQWVLEWLETYQDLDPDFGLVDVGWETGELTVKYRYANCSGNVYLLPICEEDRRDRSDVASFLESWLTQDLWDLTFATGRKVRRHGEYIVLQPLPTHVEEALLPPPTVRNYPYRRGEDHRLEIAWPYPWQMLMRWKPGNCVEVDVHQWPTSYAQRFALLALQIAASLCAERLEIHGCTARQRASVEALGFTGDSRIEALVADPMALRPLWTLLAAGSPPGDGRCR